MPFAVPQSAKESGLSLFFTGVSCARGHTSPRFVSNGKCQSCVSEDNKERFAETDAAHRKERRERYRVAKSERAKAKRRARGLLKRGPKNVQTPDEKQAKRAAWKAKNADKLSAYFRSLYQTQREAKIASATAYAKANPQVKHATRLRRKTGTSVGTFNLEDVARLVVSQRNSCAGCALKFGRRRPYQIDHIKPIAKGGTNDRANLQLLCRPCNQSKSAKDPIDWARQKGRLV